MKMFLIISVKWMAVKFILTLECFEFDTVKDITLFIFRTKCTLFGTQ